MAIVGWRVWYTEGRVFDSRNCQWQDLPDDGVLILYLYYDEWSGDGNVRHRQKFLGDDWYFHEPGTDLFGSNNDSLEENRERYPDAIFKRGKWTSFSEFQAVQQEAWESEWA